MNYVAIIFLSVSVLLSFNFNETYSSHLLYTIDTISDTISHHKMTAAEVLEKYTKKWMKIPGVIGTGEGKSGGKPCIIVLIRHKSETIRKKIPKTIDGYQVVLKETGQIKAK
jgi:hypothetical protein